MILSQRVVLTRLVMFSLLLLVVSCRPAPTSPLPQTAPAVTPSGLPATGTPAPTPTYDITRAAAARPAAAGCTYQPGSHQQLCISHETGLAYWLYLPPEYLISPGQQPPLLIYLHGFNHSGAQPEKVLGGGLALQIEKGRHLPMIAISPQCPSAHTWAGDEMVSQMSRLVDEVVTTYGADPARVYLTGFSMGGDGVWALGSAHPEQFAALAPIGSWYANTGSVCALKDVPVWDFQGQLDAVVDPHYAKDLVAALQACGGTVQLTLYPNEGHEGSSMKTYRSDELYAWLLNHRKQ